MVVRDEAIEPVTISRLPGYEFHRIWGSDARPQLPSDGTPPQQPGYFPPTEGFRFIFFTIPPETKTKLSLIDRVAAFAEVQQKLPGMVQAMEMTHPGMHTTETVDFDVVVSGECVLELDDGEEVTLKAGDCVVQNGTRHAWHNRSQENCVIAVALLGAERRR